MLNSLNWNSVETQIKELRLHTFYKIIYECVKGQLQSTFKHLATRIDVYKFSFYPNTIQLWNNLPDYIVSARSLDYILYYTHAYEVYNYTKTEKINREVMM